jgi:hypothetical protein
LFSVLSSTMNPEAENDQDIKQLKDNTREEGAIPSSASVDVNSSEFEADVIAKAPSMRGRRLNWAIAFVAGTGFTLFGRVS